MKPIKLTPEQMDAALGLSVDDLVASILAIECELEHCRAPAGVPCTYGPSQSSRFCEARIRAASQPRELTHVEKTLLAALK